MAIKKILAVILSVVIFSLPMIATASEVFYIPSTSQEAKEVKENIHEIAEDVRRLNIPDSSPLIINLQEFWVEYDKIEKDLFAKEEQARIEAEKKARFEKKYQEYYSATYVWCYLKDQGYNDAVCAGILGNMMAEVGGQGFNLRWDASGNGYYGICQWNKAYCSKVWGADLQGQCRFLIESIAYEFNTFGSNFRKGFNYSQFLNLTNCRDAALAFAKCYERCGSASYSQRQKNAEKAYAYFTN